MAALTLVPLTIIAKRADGTPVANARWRLTLTVPDKDGQLVVPNIYTGDTDANGEATPNVWPNTRGTNGSQYLVEIVGDDLRFRGLATVPAYPCSLHDVLQLQPGTVPDSQGAVLLARDWAIKTDGPVEGDELSAKAHAQAAKVDRELADQDVLATAGDRAQVAADRAVITDYKDQAVGAAGTSQAQASLAAGYAAGAGSVAQQDLSGVAAAALHRSPNAISALFIYDTSKDSDGGAWVAKVDASYLYETLNGKWLGAQASEAAARGVAGAATGDYFQLTTDGKFYRLSAGAGTTETFRGNKARFPRVAPDIAETARVVLFDALEPGRPMWRVLTASASNAVRGTAITSVTALSGCLLVGTNLGLTLIDFAKDCAINWGTGGRSRYLGTLAQCNAGLGWVVEDSSKAIASNTVNSLASCFMPEAPTDPVTGLQAPTIAVGTSGGLSIIKHDGSVVSSANNSSHTSVAINQYMVQGNAGSTMFYALNPSSLGAGFALNTLASGLGSPDFGRGTVASQVLAKRGLWGRRETTVPNKLAFMRFNEITPAASLAAQITDTYNTGWMVGDVRRCVFSDVTPGLANNGDPVSDRSYKGKNATVVGTLTKTAVAAAAQLVLWGGFSAANYAQEAYSADLDFGTAGFAMPVAMLVPTFLQAGGTSALQNTPWAPTAAQSACFPDASGELLVNGSPMAAAGWTVEAAGWTFAGGVATHTPGNTGRLYQVGLASANLWRVIVTISGMTAGTVQVGGNTVQNAATIINANGTYTFFVAPNGGILYLSPSSNFDGSVTSASVKEVGPSVLADRSAASGGANWQVGVDAMGRVVVTVVDAAATSRTARSSSAYGGLGVILAEPSLTSGGTLSVRVNGEPAGQTTGAPLASLSNATAVMTWGNRRQLDAAFIGSIALARPTVTVPTEDQSRFIYQQERAMFRDGAQVTLPDSGALVDLDYDPTEDKWKPVSAANESTFVGLVRIASAPAAAGSISKVSHKGGMKLIARTTAIPGVDVTIPARNLKEEELRRAEELARQQLPQPPLDWQGAFTANTLNNSALITVTGNSLVIPTDRGATLVGARVTGTNIPAGTTVLGVNGTQVQLSAPCTGLGAGVTVNILDLVLPIGQSPHIVCTAGAAQREGTTQAWTRGFDGFRERVSYIGTPGNQWLQVETRRAA